MSLAERIEPCIREAITELKAGHAELALARLEDALCVDPDDEETLDTLKCLNWWLEKFEALEGIATSYDEGFFIMGQWGAYGDFIKTLDKDEHNGFDSAGNDRGRYAVRHFVYASALRSFEEALADPTPRHDPGLLLHIGRCYKGMGNYEESLSFLRRAVRHLRYNGAALAELADVYALLGDEKDAKITFKEAFFIDPDSIDANVLECAMITGLVKKVRALDVKEDEVSLWIPIYGTLFGVFPFKKKLELVELGRLNQEVFALRDEVRKNPSDTKAVPRLFCRYFRLLDHYETCDDESEKISEIQMCIRLIDEKFYNSYMKAGPKN